jgi:hypothetical protein
MRPRSCRLEALAVALLAAGAAWRGSAGPLPGAGAAAVKAAPAPRADAAARADELVRAMGKLLAGPGLAVRVEEQTDVVTAAGQKIEADARSTLYLERPDRLRVDRAGEQGSVSLYYDGRRVVLHASTLDYYATASAPRTLELLLPFLLERFDLAIPGGDLLLADASRALMEESAGMSYLGDARVEGVACHHLAGRARAADWQLWIDKGDRPFPRKYVITSRGLPTQPQHAVVFSDWNLEPRLEPALFRFTPPGGSERLELVAVSAAGAPAHAERVALRTIRQTTPAVPAPALLPALPSQCAALALAEGPAYDCGGKRYRPVFRGWDIMYQPLSTPGAGRDAGTLRPPQP